jgi:putative transposase
MMSVQQHSFQLPVKVLLQWVGLAPSSYYYKVSNGPRGFTPSTHTWRRDGRLSSNSSVIEDIKRLLMQEFVCYGYHKVTEVLRSTYRINHKKVYRLMGENHLLYNQKIRVHSGKRSFVRYRRINAEYPLQYLCMDIKYVYIHGEGRNAYLLSLLDVFTRRVLRYVFKTSIKQQDVILMLDATLNTHPTKGITLRNDNGSQFIAGSVRTFLKDRDVLQEFSHVSTPEDNAYIEAFHSILEREVIVRYEFDSFYHAERTLANYYRFYNEKRIHSALNYKTPIEIWNQFFKEQNQNHLNQLTKTIQSIGG